jgi:hypothetical protein
MKRHQRSSIGHFSMCSGQIPPTQLELVTDRIGPLIFVTATETFQLLLCPLMGHAMLLLWTLVNLNTNKEMLSPFSLFSLPSK